MVLEKDLRQENLLLLLSFTPKWALMRLLSNGRLLASPGKIRLVWT
jgi:hypothetical protein